jgi:hypothetical protein
MFERADRLGERSIAPPECQHLTTFERLAQALGDCTVSAGRFRAGSVCLNSLELCKSERLNNHAVFNNAGAALQQLSEHSAIKNLADLMAKIASSAAHNAHGQCCSKRTGGGGANAYRCGSCAKTKTPSERA